MKSDFEHIRVDLPNSTGDLFARRDDDAAQPHLPPRPS
jgi:hypothetical protein|tara:strand:- start:545 stop:658 length:114 start_codon:yes stop_codon:yes gene_type:complete